MKLAAYIVIGVIVIGLLLWYTPLGKWIFDWLTGGRF